MNKATAAIQRVPRQEDNLQLGGTRPGQTGIQSSATCTVLTTQAKSFFPHMQMKSIKAKIYFETANHPILAFSLAFQPGRGTFFIDLL
jgi:hypothetical protein